MQNEENLSALEAPDGPENEEKQPDDVGSADKACGEKQLVKFERLPPPYQLLKMYVDSRDAIHQECLNTQTFPLPSWSVKDVEAYLINPWIPIPWTNAKQKLLPFGYEKRPEEAVKLGLDPDFILFPIPDELFALQEAKKLIHEYSVDSVAQWLHEKTGRKITPNALRRRIKQEKERQSKATFYRRQAVRIAKALISAQKIEEEFPGSKVPWARQCDVFGEPRFADGNPQWAKNVYQLFKCADPRPFIKTVKDRMAKEVGAEPDDNPTKIPLLDYEFGGGRARGDFSPAEFSERNSRVKTQKKARVRAKSGATD